MKEMKMQYPIVFVHGMYGWGDKQGINKKAPYWGGTAGSITEYLSGKGIECYAASNGPISSAWDQTCELYAQLTGTRVDYGEHHSRVYGHKRFGRTYDKPIFENWSKEKKVHLIGHSFGGQVSRLLVHLLENGAPDEIALSRDDTSPLFLGGQKDLVCSVTAICSPLNGTDAYQSVKKYHLLPMLKFVTLNSAVILGRTKLQGGLIDVHLEQMGVNKTDEIKDTKKFVEVMKDLFLCKESIDYDMTDAGTEDLNGFVKIVPSVYYFSFPFNLADKNEKGKKELIVSWQTSTNMYQLGVYSLKNNNPGGDLLSSNGGVMADQLPEATDLMTTTYSGYSLLDIDQDNRTELAVIRIDSAGINSLVELYGWRDGSFSSLGVTRLSNGIAALIKVRSNFVSGSIRAIYITGQLVDASQSTDIVAWRDDKLVNLTLNKESGVSNETIRDYIVSLTDVNNDIILEMPEPHTIPVYGGGISRDHYLIKWSQYDLEGNKNPVFTTYHNQLDNWYFEVPDYWRGEITIERDDSVTGERGVVFYHWNGPEEEPSPFMVIYKLTGINRTLRATQGDRFILSEDDSTIYAANLIPCKWDHGLDETDVLNRFHRTITSWANE